MNYFKPADLFILIFAAAVLILLSVRAANINSAVLYARITAENGVWEYPLDEKREFFLEGPAGKTEVHIENGKVHVVESACRDKLCIHAGEIQRGGEWLACLPNSIFILIIGKNGDGPDAKTY
jgi:hypothetical protein